MATRHPYGNCCNTACVGGLYRWSDEGSIYYLNIFVFVCMLNLENLVFMLAQLLYASMAARICYSGAFIITFCLMDLIAFI